MDLRPGIKITPDMLASGDSNQVVPSNVGLQSGMKITPDMLLDSSVMQAPKGNEFVNTLSDIGQAVSNPIDLIAGTMRSGFEQAIGGFQQKIGEQQLVDITRGQRPLRTFAGITEEDPLANAEGYQAGIARIQDTIQAGKDLYAEGQALDQGLREAFPQKSYLGGIARGVTSSVGFQLPGMAAAIINPALAVPLTAGMFITTAGQKYGERRADGFDIETAQRDANFQGTVEVLTEMGGAYFMGKFFEAAKAGLPVLKPFVKNLVSEVVGESAATTLQGSNDFVREDEANKITDYVLSKRHIYDQIDTLVSVLMQSGVTGGVGAVQSFDSKSRAKKQIKDIDGLIDSLSKTGDAGIKLDDGSLISVGELRRSKAEIQREFKLEGDKGPAPVVESIEEVPVDIPSIAARVAELATSPVLSKTEQAAATVERIKEIDAKLAEVNPATATVEELEAAGKLQRVKERLERGYENISEELGGESSPLEQPKQDTIQNSKSILDPVVQVEKANEVVRGMVDHFATETGDSLVYQSPKLLSQGNFIEDLLISTGIRSKVALLDITDIENSTMPDGDVLALKQRLTDTKNFGVVKEVRDSDGRSRWIAVVNSPEILKGRGSADTMRMTEAAVHEAFGHVVVGERYSWASEETKLALEKDFQRYTKLPADEATKAFYPLKTGEIAIGVPEGMEAQVHFKEWLVNGITKWATSEAAPIGLANKWFKKLADAFKKAFKKDGSAQTPESIRAWMNSMFDSSRLRDKAEVEQPVKIVEPHGGYKKVSITKQLEKLKAVVKPEDLKAYEVGKIEGKDETHLGIYKKDSSGNKVLINQIKSTSRSSAQREANLFKYAHALASRGMSEPVSSSSARIRHYQDMLSKFKGEIQNVAEQTGQSFEQVWLDFLGNPHDALGKHHAILSRSPQTERIWTGIENLAKHSPERLRKLIVYEKRVISKEVQELVKAEEVLKAEIAEGSSAVDLYRSVESLRVELSRYTGESVANSIYESIDTKLSDTEGPARTELAGPGGRGVVFYEEFQKEMQRIVAETEKQAKTPGTLVAKRIQREQAKQEQRSLDFMREADKVEANELVGQLEGKRLTNKQLSKLEDLADVNDSDALLDYMYELADTAPDKLKLVKKDSIQNLNLNFEDRIRNAAQESALNLIKVGSKVNLERIQNSVIEKLRLSGKDARDAKKFIKENYESLRDGKKIEASILEEVNKNIESQKVPDEVSLEEAQAYMDGLSDMAVIRDKENFDRWFGNSVIKNVDGSPREMFHGTSKDVDFKSFKNSKRGIFFTPEKEGASQYSIENDSMKLVYENGKFERRNERARVIPVFLRLENPYRFTDADMEAYKFAKSYTKFQTDLAAKAKALGHDGIEYPGDVWVVFDSKQIKSSIGNSGAFSSKSSNIDEMAVRRKSKPITGPLYEKINKIKKKKETTPEQASEKIRKRLAKEAEFVQETSKLEEAANKANVSLTEYLRAVGKDKDGNPLSEDTIAKILRKYQRLAKTIFTDQEHILRLGTALGLVDGTTGVAGLEAYIKTVFPKAQGPIKQLTITGRDILMKRMQDRWFELEGQKFDFSKIKTFRELVNLSREERASWSGWKKFKSGLAYYINQNVDEIATTPAGSSLVHLLKNVLNSEAALYTRDYPARLQRIMELVTDPKDREHILDVYEGKAVARNKVFQEGADLMREIYHAYGTEMERLGVRIQYKGGYTSEFKFDPNANHYPHMWEPGSFDKPSEKMLNSLLVSGQPVDAKQAAAIIKSYGNRATRLAAPKFANLEMAREIEMDGYIRDPLKVTMQYLMSGAKRLAILREVGQQPEVRLAQLAWDHFQQSGDADSYNFAVKVINSITGVPIHERLMEKSGWMANPLEFAALASTLQHSAFVQPGVLANTITIAGFRRTAEGIRRYIRADPRKKQMSKEWAETLGANGRSVTKELLDEMHDSLSLATKMDKLMHFWRIPQVDTFFRNSAALTGRLHINEMVERSINLGDKKAEQELRRLGLSSAKFKELLESGKDELVEDELRKGAYAFAQRTNLVNDALTKAQWTMEHSSFSRMLTLLGRFSFQQHHFLKSLYKDDPRKLVKYLGVASAIGVPGYVSKTLMKGKNPIEDAKERGLFGTWIAMLQNAAGLGMFMDMTLDGLTQVVTGKQGHAADRVGGPLPGLAKDTLVGASKIAHGDLSSAAAMRLLLRSGVVVSAGALPPKYGVPIAGTLGLARPAIETLVKENK